MKLALDAMGSDHAPRVELEGLAEFHTEKPEAEVFLVGQEELLTPRARRSHNLHIIHAPTVVGMHEAPTYALRQKQGSSISKAFDLLKDGRVKGLVSAGNTGAVMAFALSALGTVSGVDRPALGAFFPTPQGSTLVLDIGANVAPRPEHLVQFATMGSVVATLLDDKAKPTVGLMNVGHEAQKGNELARVTYEKLARGDLNFVGNIEGHEVMRGKVDVVVCDGFVGNVMLKFGEGMAAIIDEMMTEYLASESRYRLRRWISKPVLHEFIKRMDYQEHGGALLLGVNGTVVIGHGRSSPRAVKNALHVAARCAELDVPGHIRARFARTR